LFVGQFRVSGPQGVGLHCGTRRAVGLLTPLVLGAVVWRLDPIVDRYLGSFLDPGSIAQMGYTARLASGLMLIGTSGLSIVAFPAIAAHAAAGRRQEFAAEIAHAFRFFLFLMAPIAIGVSVFSVPVVRLLFEHGKFTPGDTAAVAWLLVLSVGLILGSGLGDLLSRTCYAEQDMRTPVVVSIVAFFAAVALKFWLAAPLGAAGIVAATSIYSLLNVALLGWVLLGRLSSSILAGTAGTSLRAVAGSLIACLAAAGVLSLPLRGAVLPAAMVGAATYALAMWLLGDEFAVQFGRWLQPRATMRVD
jgi:putative peptidoglycan lipid II flippase